MWAREKFLSETSGEGAMGRREVRAFHTVLRASTTWGWEGSQSGRACVRVWTRRTACERTSVACAAVMTWDWDAVRSWMIRWGDSETLRRRSEASGEARINWKRVANWGCVSLSAK